MSIGFSSLTLGKQSYLCVFRSLQKSLLSFCFYSHVEYEGIVTPVMVCPGVEVWRCQWVLREAGLTTVLTSCCYQSHHSLLSTACRQSWQLFQTAAYNTSYNFTLRQSQHLELNEFSFCNEQNYTNFLEKETLNVIENSLLVVTESNVQIFFLHWRRTKWSGKSALLLGFLTDNAEKEDPCKKLTTLEYSCFLYNPPNVASWRTNLAELM